MNTQLINCAIDRQSAAVVFRTLQQHARDLGITLRQPPPEPTTCCGRGCNGCVWEGFYAAATFWREDAWLAIQTSSKRLSHCRPEQACG